MSAPMTVILSDPVVSVRGWTPDLDDIGAYELKRRKSPGEIREEFAARRARYGDAARSVSPVERVPQNCITHDAADLSTAYFLPGLWPRVKDELGKRGRAYEVVDRRNMAIRPPLDLAAFEGVEFRETQDVAVALIATQDCGIIETATAYGKSFCIALVCKALPTLNIVVTTASAQVVATLYEYLCSQIPGQVGVKYNGKDTTAGKRVVCTTLKSLPNIPPDNVHLVLVDECHSVADNDAGRALMKFCWARRFGFSASPVRNDGTQKVMESILGPTILKMTYQEAAEAGMVTPMKYLMLPCCGCPPSAQRQALPEVMLKRFSYWDNTQRNQVIRRFVYDLKEHYSGQILIMVSTLRHAINLARLLPWFKVAYYGQADLKDLQERMPGIDVSKYKLSARQLDIMRCAFAKGTLRYVVATKTWKQGVNFPHLSCLIRADGDVSAVEGIQIPGRLARLDKGKEFAYLVDVADTFSTWAAGRAAAREKLYRSQQWQPVGYQELINELGSTENDDEEDDGAVCGG